MRGRLTGRTFGLTRRAFLERAGLATGLAAFGMPAGVALPTADAAPHDAPAKTRVLAFIANSLSNTVTLADGHTLEPFGTLRVGREPHKFHRSLSGTSVYSLNSYSAATDEMIEIDLRTLTPVRHIPILDPYNITFTADGRYLYKVAYRYTFVEVHDAQTFRPITRIETGRQPSHYWLADDRGWFVNANQHADAVTVIDTRTMRVIHRLPVDPLPAGVALSRDTRHLFVASGGAGTINVFATDDWKFTKRVHSGKDAHEMVMTRDGRTIYVTNRGEDTVSAFDVPQQRVAAKFHVPGGPDMPMLSPDESQLWVSGRYGDTATVVDTRTLRILNTFPTERSPHGVFLTRAAA
ncbi:MAG TPA: beta-propeller fold lactonase family protein [bacterium]|nr:beta-propeller fold lactonase family protein [bacterium]